ncbi:MAG: peptidylprolyl isomerase [Sedimentisphaerales bacterium]|nr:peptidylprolyl isomerase [Sedimentisphaerales bacterium]
MLFILADYISDILLYKSAKKEIGDSLDEYLDKSIEGEIKKIAQQFGGDEVKADELIKQKWYDRETYKKLLKREILTQWFLSTQKTDDSFIPYRQLIRKYESMKDENFAIEPEIEFRSIDIRPSRLELTDPNLDRNKYAEDLANEIYSKLKSGEDFGELAKQYSQGHRKDFGGLWDPVNPESLAEPFDVIADTAIKMNPGEISEPIKTDSYIFIIKLEKKKPAGYIPFEQVQVDVRKAVIVERSQKKALSQLDESINQQMERYETGVFVEYCLDKIYKESHKEQ